MLTKTATGGSEVAYEGRTVTLRGRFTAAELYEIARDIQGDIWTSTSIAQRHAARVKKQKREAREDAMAIAYVQHRNMAAVAAEFGLSLARTSQILRHTAARYRDRLGRNPPENAAFGAQKLCENEGESAQLGREMSPDTKDNDHL